MILKAIAITFGAYAVMEAGVCALARSERRAKEEEEERRRRAEFAALKAQEEKMATGSELLEKLSRAYKKAKKAGVHNFWLVAVSQCCWKLRNGEEIDEGAALFALRGLEGDDTYNPIVRGILEERKRNTEEWD